MARTLSPEAVAHLSGRLGIEPYNSITTVFGSFIDEILELGNLDVVQSSLGSSSNATVSVKLDDTSGLLKSVIDRLDIHKTPIKIYQHFKAVTDYFLIFEGVINSPIIWSEAERTLSFEATSRLEDREVGFSPEDGQFENLNERLIGKAWPLAFGKNHFAPAMPINTIPAAITQDSFGFPDPGLMEQRHRLTTQAGLMLLDMQRFRDEAGRLLFLAALAHFQGDLQAEEAMKQQSVQLQENAFALEEQVKELTRQAGDLLDLWSQQMAYYKSKFKVKGDLGFPQGKITIKLGEMIFQADSQIHNEEELIWEILLTPAPSPMGGYPTTSVNFDPDDNYRATDGKTGATRRGFTWFGAGTQVSILSPWPMHHIVSANEVEVTDVYAYRSYNGLRRLTKLPRAYYSVSYPLGSSGWYRPTVVTLVQPLSIISYLNNLEEERLPSLISRADNSMEFITQNNIYRQSEWEDDIWVSLESPIGPNIITIMQWIITHFTSLTWDEDSFQLANAYLAAYPAHFMLFEKKNVIGLLNEMAYQARCAIWIKNEVFYIKYLPAKAASIATIGEEDIEHGSMEIYCTDTEEVITKTVNRWKSDYLDGRENKSILKYNYGRYGIHESDHDYYIYNIHYLVKKSATFWLIRTSHTWKKVRFKAFLHLMNVEAFDTVTLSFTHADLSVASGSITGIVESALYDPADNMISMEIWLPVLFGTMEEYDFAFPRNISEYIGLPPKTDLEGGSTVPEPEFTSRLPYYHGDDQGRTTINIAENKKNGYNDANERDSHDPLNSPYQARRPDGSIVAVSPTASYSDPHIHPADAFDAFPELKAPHVLEPPVEDLRPSYDYELKDASVKLEFEEETAKAASTFPGQIVSKTDTTNTYLVDVYTQGLTSDPTRVRVLQLDLEPTETIPAGNWTLVVRNYDANDNAVWYMQTPIFLMG